MLGALVYNVIFLTIPVIMILFFGISLFRYCFAISQNKANPETFSPEEIKKRKILLIVASVIAGIFLLIVIGFIVLLYMAVAYM